MEACGPLTSHLAEAQAADPSTLFIDEDEEDEEDANGHADGDGDDDDDEGEGEAEGEEDDGGGHGHGSGHATGRRRPVSALAQAAALSRAKRACAAADACVGSAREGSSCATAGTVLMEACRRLGGFQAGSSAEVAALGPRAAEYDARHLAMPVLEPGGSLFLPLVRVRLLANCRPLRGELDKEAAQAAADAMRRELDDALKAYRARNPDAAALLPA
ncbi:hypothetical protein FNF27_08051 [Cafeteria roenbergensis]|nr:hypothetical protein FNF28_06195 [Cafeteria roenbergensis]KAA0162535.1 hypothetical protein FNF27_08051 [Cafeteria roenbergensis]